MRKLLVAVAALALITTACAKSKEPGVSSGKNPVTLSGQVNAHGTKDVSGNGSSVTLELEADDFYFEPTFVKAAPGAKISVEVKNEGKNTHTFTIDLLSIDQTISPDGSKTVEVVLPASGVINFYCKFHRGQGMQGAFYFTAGGSAPSPGGSDTGGYHYGS